jgi:Fe-S-cluster-containing hydrogenase component 2
MSKHLEIDPLLCYQCALCVAVCFADALWLHPHHLSVGSDACTLCNDCVIACPVEALAIP